MGIPKSTALYSSCPGCGGDDPGKLWDVDGYSIAKCAVCSLVFVKNQVTADELDEYYAGVVDEAYDEDNIECLNYYYETLAGLIQSRFPTPGRVLDLGCASGWFLDAMRGWECHGNEIVASRAAEARERYGDRIVTGSFEEYPMREGFFDVITLQDVFDHFRDPMPALEKCYRMLRPGGLIAIKVHNISCLYAKLTGPRFYAILPPSHLFYYDKRTLSNVLAKNGFHVVDTRFIGHIMKVKMVIWRLSRGDASSRFRSLYRLLDRTALGEFKFHKNLHDIITVLAVKPA